MSAFRDDAAARRYELNEGDGVSFCDYRIDQSGMRLLTHVETPEAARGRGAAGRLMAAIVADARAHGHALAALCSYAVAWRKRHPGTADVLS